MADGRLAVLARNIARNTASFARGMVQRSATPVRGSLFGWVREGAAGEWQRGNRVDPLGSITSFGAVFACVSRISFDIAKLEPRLMSTDDQGIRTPASRQSPYWNALRAPNPFQNRIQMLCYWMVAKLLHGNAYFLKARDKLGIVYRLYPLDPRRVTPMITEEGDVYYSLGGDDLARVPAGMVVPASEIIHDRGVTLWHPLVGVSPIYACGISATQGARIQSNSSVFFENMSRPSGMITAPHTIDDVTAERIKRDWDKNYSAANIGKLAVLGDGLTYEAMTVPAVEAQLIEQLGWTVEDVARCFDMPLYKINAGPVPTAGNVETLETQYYTGCLQKHIEAMELCLTEGLGLGRAGTTSRLSVELDLDGLLRMDSATKVDMLTKAITGTLMSPDEARARMNLPPVSGGASPMAQHQQYSLAALAKRDAKPDPFASGAATAAAAPASPAADPTEDEESAKQLAAAIVAHMAALELEHG
jgi:HK97 family phage portal protein